MTLFDGLVRTVLSESIVGRAEKAGIIEINVHNIRDYSEDKHRRVDDTPYGGGKGMVMSAVPIYNCFSAITAPEVNPCERRRVIYMSPQGKILTQARAKELAENYDNLVILCGHYAGVDERIIEEIVDEEISIGRMIDGVLAAPECYEDESLSDGTLEYPQYTRPYDFRGRLVPDVLLSGHHANIEAWRKEKSLERTREKRPDLLGGENTEKED